MRLPTPATAVRLLACAIAVGVCLLMLAPVLPRWPAALVYGLASLVCHQRPERSFYWGPIQFAVCARCTGLYAGAIAGAVAAAVVGDTRLVRAIPALRGALLVAAVPTGVTVAAEWIGAWAPSHVVRALAGLPLGAATAVAAVCAAATLHLGGWPHRRGPFPPHRHS